MEFKNTVKQEGGLKISVAVIEKVAKIAAMEVEGVSNVSVGSSGVKGFLAKTNLPKAVEVTMFDGVADITVHVVVKYGVKLPAVCKDVQQAVKAHGAGGVDNLFKAVQKEFGVDVKAHNKISFDYIF